MAAPRRARRSARRVLHRVVRTAPPTRTEPREDHVHTAHTAHTRSTPLCPTHWQVRGAARAHVAGALSTSRGDAPLVRADAARTRDPKGALLLFLSSASVLLSSSYAIRHVPHRLARPSTSSASHAATLNGSSQPSALTRPTQPTRPAAARAARGESSRSSRGSSMGRRRSCVRRCRSRHSASTRKLCTT